MPKPKRKGSSSKCRYVSVSVYVSLRECIQIKVWGDRHHLLLWMQSLQDKTQQKHHHAVELGVVQWGWSYCLGWIGSPNQFLGVSTYTVRKTNLAQIAGWKTSLSFWEGLLVQGGYPSTGSKDRHLSTAPTLTKMMGEVDEMTDLPPIKPLNIHGSVMLHVVLSYSDLLMRAQGRELRSSGYI